MRVTEVRNTPVFAKQKCLKKNHLRLIVAVLATISGPVLVIL